MRSPAEVRVWVERALRATSLVILAVMLWRSLNVESAEARGGVEGTATVADLRTWSMSPVAPTAVQVTLDSLPQPTVRDWLAALRLSGSRVGWTGEFQPIAVATSSIPSPDRGTNVLIAAPKGSIIELRDDIAPFDTVQADEGGARFVVHADGPFIARVSGSRAVAVRRDSSILRRVLVLGSAGWESEFTTAALEESGWKVDAMIRVAPGVDVSQNAGYHIDTARYSAVVALDESASPWADAIDEYARSGGGVIIGPAAAAKMPQALRIATVGPAVVIAMTPSDAVPVTLEKTPLSALQSLPADAIVLRRRGEDVAVAARRYAAGRVIEIGYPESWRWRMGGDERAAENHRQWWSSLVSAVAYAPRLALPVSTANADNAPFAALVSAIGRATAPELAAKQPVPASRSMAWLGLLLSITLLSEIASRRLRGAK